MSVPWLDTSDISDDDLLAATKVAIAKILQFGQAKGLRGEMLTRANMPALLDLKKQLTLQISRRSRGLAANRAIRVRS
jgi:hypothetical protein